MSSEVSITKLEENILTDWQAANKEPLNAVANGRMWNQRAVIMGSIAVTTSIAQAVIPYTPFAASAAFAMPFMAPVVAITSALTFFAGLFAFKNLSTPPEFLGVKIKETVVTDNPETVNKLQTATQQLEANSKEKELLETQIIELLESNKKLSTSAPLNSEENKKLEVENKQLTENNKQNVLRNSELTKENEKLLEEIEKLRQKISSEKYKSSQNRNHDNRPNEKRDDREEEKDGYSYSYELTGIYN